MGVESAKDHPAIIEGTAEVRSEKLSPLEEPTLGQLKDSSDEHAYEKYDKLRTEASQGITALHAKAGKLEGKGRDDLKSRLREIGVNTGWIEPVDAGVVVDVRRDIPLTMSQRSLVAAFSDAQLNAGTIDMGKVEAIRHPQFGVVPSTTRALKELKSLASAAQGAARPSNFDFSVSPQENAAPIASLTTSLSEFEGKLVQETRLNHIKPSA